MTENKVLYEFEDAPHIELNQDGSTIDLSNWRQPPNRNWSYRHCVDVLPFTQKIRRGDGPVHDLGDAAADLSAVTRRMSHRLVD